MQRLSEETSDQVLAIKKGHIPTELSQEKGRPWIKVAPSRNFWPIKDDERSDRVTSLVLSIHEFELEKDWVIGTGKNGVTIIHFVGSTAICGAEYNLLGWMLPHGRGRVGLELSPTESMRKTLNTFDPSGLEHDMSTVEEAITTHVDFEPFSEVGDADSLLYSAANLLQFVKEYKTRTGSLELPEAK